MLTANLLTINPTTNPISVQPTPIVFCALLMSAAAVILFAVLRYQFLRLAAEVADREREATKFASELEAQTLLSKQLSADLDELRKHLLNHDERNRAATSIWPNARIPMNLNRRGQILRLSRKGKSVAEIASDLQVAQGEVELLLKVHDLGPKSIGSEK